MQKITTINITTPLRNIMGDATGAVTKTKAKRGARSEAKKPHSLAILLPLFMLLLTLSPIHNAWGSKEEMYKKYQHLTPDQLHRGLSQFKQPSYCQNYGYDNPNCATDRENMIAALKQLIAEKNTPIKTATAKPSSSGDGDIVGSSGGDNIVGGEGNDGVGSSLPKKHTKDFWVKQYRGNIPPKALKDKLGVVQDSNYCKNNNFEGCEKQSKAQAAAYQYLIDEQSSSTSNTGKSAKEVKKTTSIPPEGNPKRGNIYDKQYRELETSELNKILTKLNEKLKEDECLRESSCTLPRLQREAIKSVLTEREEYKKENENLNTRELAKKKRDLKRICKKNPKSEECSKLRATEQSATKKYEELTEQYEKNDCTNKDDDDPTCKQIVQAAAYIQPDKKGPIPQAINVLASDLSNLEDGICEIVKILERDVAYVVAVLAIIVLAIKGMFLGLKPMDILVCLISLSLLAGGHREVLYAIFEEDAFLEACDGPGKSSGGGSSGGGSGGSGGSSYTGSPGYPGTGGGYGGGSRNYYPVSNQDGTRSSSGSDGSSGTVRGDKGYRTPPFSSGGPDGNYDYGYLDGKGGIKFDPYTGEYIGGSNDEVPECDPPYNMENCKFDWWNGDKPPPNKKWPVNKDWPPPSKDLYPPNKDWSGIQNPNTPGILPIPAPPFPGPQRPNFPGGGYNDEPKDIGVGGRVDLNIRDLPPWVNALPTMDKSDEDFKQTCNQARIYANDMNRELRNSKQSGSNITEVDACRGNPYSDLCKLTAVYRRNFNSFITNASSNGKLQIASSNENMFIVPKCPNF